MQKGTKWGIVASITHRKYRKMLLKIHYIHAIKHTIQKSSIDVPPAMQYSGEGPWKIKELNFTIGARCSVHLWLARTSVMK